ncbi:MAG: apolipoprotein N-acyltransferase, partial [Candidatus Neomarinimicrobiota bacterium]|nr:apolipoprotein N-acyltransferase [Candidatus Neomarinimicrobiota bacterium]
MKKPIFSPLKLALISGLLVGLSYPPFFGILALFAFIPLIRVWLTVKIIDSIKYSYFAAIIANAISLYWIGLNTGASFLPVMISLVAAILYLSIFWAILGGAISWFKDRFNYVEYLIPFLWVSMELIRSYGPLAFSWSNLALTQTKFISILQIIDTTGSEGVAFWIIFINVALYLSFFTNKLNPKKNLILFLMAIIPIFYGSYKLHALKNINWEKRNISIIQPNIDPNQKWEASYRNELYEVMDSLNTIAYSLKPDLVLWPEAALPNYMRVSYLNNKFEKLVDSTSIPLMMGTLDYKASSNDKKIYNGSIFFSSKKNKLYHKLFLVPFAEYIPLSSIFPILKQLNFGQGNFSHGDEFTTFELDSVLFSNMICYDSTNPLLARKFFVEGARFLTIEANVAWLQNSSGVRQYYEIAKLRAVEYRTGIAMSANTGISAIINPFGKETHKA